AYAFYSCPTPFSYVGFVKSKPQTTVKTRSSLLVSFCVFVISHDFIYSNTTRIKKTVNRVRDFHS
ncbi:MAG: hypothetical protein KAJ00_02870, partial [Deltaproteobacteria bacterium]|nr:hypothetical protein [Deltaproteobacteria bacterium]